ncbi:hypothetical protein [Streptomyces sp. NPDC059744]|uniref:hypothetical protein n=1 Tax=Streptomyces sp. NPDC059744 TaxID=3346929 RepID=UPI003666AE3D
MGRKHLPPAAGLLGVPESVRLAVETVLPAAGSPGEPCYNSTGFAESSCNQAWRWNLGFAWS